MNEPRKLLLRKIDHAFAQQRYPLFFGISGMGKHAAAKAYAAKHNLACKTLIDELKAKDYRVVYDLQEADAVDRGRIVGLFDSTMSDMCASSAIFCWNRRCTVSASSASVRCRPSCTS